jgi:hypothetical protein
VPIEFYIAGYNFPVNSNHLPNGNMEANSYWAGSLDIGSMSYISSGYFYGSRSLQFSIGEIEQVDYNDNIKLGRNYVVLSYDPSSYVFGGVNATIRPQYLTYEVSTCHYQGKVRYGFGMFINFPNPVPAKMFVRKDDECYWSEINTITPITADSYQWIVFTFSDGPNFTVDDIGQSFRFGIHFPSTSNAGAMYYTNQGSYLSFQTFGTMVTCNDSGGIRLFGGGNIPAWGII